MSAFDQSTYQVRLEWGVAGLARLAPADIVVVVDVLGGSTTVIEALESEKERGEESLERGGDAARVASSVDAARIAEVAAGAGGLVFLGALRNAAAVAAAVLAEQERRGSRTSVAVIAAGERTGADAAAEVRFAVEDQLGAGAVIAALGSLGIDHTSPEAAVAAEAFRALRRAVTHLLTAAGSGRALIDRGLREQVVSAAAVDAASVVPVLREGTFRAL